MPKETPGIRANYKPTEAEYDEIRQVYDRFQDMKAARAPFEKDWEKAEKNYMGYRPTKDADDWSSDIFVPLTSSIVEAELSEIVTQSLKPMIVERGSEDTPKAMVMRHLFDYSWDIGKADVEMFDILKSALIKGTGIGQEYYLKQPRKIRTLKDGKITEEEVMEYDDCYLEAVKLEDFYPDDKGRGFFGPHGCRDAIRRHIMHIDDFKNYFTGKWDPQNRARFVQPGGDTNYFEFYKPPEGIRKDKDVEVLWYWNKPEDKLIVVANDVRVVSMPLPYKHKQLPFARAVDIKDIHQFYGRGEPKLLESIQEELNILRRQILDRNHLDIDKPMLVSDKLTLDAEDSIAEPHKMIPVSDVNQVKPLEYGDISASAFRSIEMLQEDAIRSTGMDVRMQSVSPSARTTATEAAILKEATLRRLQLKIWMLKRDFLVDIGRLRVSNIIQFYPQPKMERIVGERGSEYYKQNVEKARSEGNLVETKTGAYQKKYRNIRLKDTAIDMSGGMMKEIPAKGYTFFEAKPDFFLPTHGGFDIRYEATSDIPLSKPLMIQQKSEMYDRLANNPQVDPWVLAKRYLETNDEIPDDFKMKQQGQDADVPTPDSEMLQQLVELAGQENEQMMAGNQVPPTPYSSPAHTEIHIEFMNGEDFKKFADEETVQNFSDHITGELMAQGARGGQSGVPMMDQTGAPGGVNPEQMGGNTPPPPGQPGQSNIIQGGAQVASAMKPQMGPATGREMRR